MWGEVALLPELEFRNWSGRYFCHIGWDVSGLFSKCPSPLWAKERIAGLCHTRGLSPQAASYTFIQPVGQSLGPGGHSIPVSQPVSSSASQPASLAPSRKPERAETGGAKGGKALIYSTSDR